MSCGIRYSNPVTLNDGIGCDVFGYTACSDLEYTNSPDGTVAHEWPYSGGGNRLIWVRTYNCQQTVRGNDGAHAVACVFYVYAYSPDEFEVTRNENLLNGPELQVIDCPTPAGWDLEYPSHAGKVGFGQPGYNPCGSGGTGDLTPPVLISASGTAGSPTVSITFSEAVSGGATTPSNYAVYPTGDPSSPLTVTSAAVSLNIVTLTLVQNLAGSTTYTVEVSNVEDLSANTIAPNSTIGFVTGYLDTTPPTLVSASGAAGTDHVVVAFSENVSSGAGTPSNFSVYPSGDPGSPLTVTLASPLNNSVTLTVSPNLAGSTSYTVEVSNVEDPAGNPVAPNSTASFTTGPGDATPVELVSATGTSGQNTVSLSFSETVGTGADVPANYSVYPTADPSSPLTVNSAAPSLSNVTLTLASNLASSTAYTVEVSNVQDLAGNAIAPGSTAGFTTGTVDTTPPTLTNAAGATGANAVVVWFSEPVALGATAVPNYAVYPTANPAGTLTINSATAVGSQVTLSLTTVLGASTSYTVEVSNVQDASGNAIAPNSTVSFTTGTSGGGMGDQSRAVVTVHVRAHNLKGLDCAALDPNLRCDQFTTGWPIQSPADVYFVIAQADPVFGVSGVSLGVQYGNTAGVQTDGQACDVFGYVSCSDLEYTNGVNSGDSSTDFPAAGGGNRLIWVRTDNCQRHELPPYGVHVTVCAFYVYAYGPDVFRVDMNRNLHTPDEFQIVDCPGPALSDMAYPGHAGFVAFGATSGFNPCTSVVTPTVKTTWGRLKNQYH